MDYEALKKMTIKERSRYLWSSYSIFQKLFFVFGLIVISLGSIAWAYDTLIKSNYEIVGRWSCADGDVILAFENDGGFSASYNLGTRILTGHGTYTESGNKLYTEISNSSPLQDEKSLYSNVSVTNERFEWTMDNGEVRSCDRLSDTTSHSDQIDTDSTNQQSIQGSYTQRYADQMILRLLSGPICDNYRSMLLQFAGSSTPDNIATMQMDKVFDKAYDAGCVAQ